LDGQRVRLLTKGYLRGWLTFEYPQKGSKLRENIIVYRLEGEEYEDLLKERLRKDTTIISGLQNKTGRLLKIIDDAYELYIGLKLPELAKKLKIGNEKQLANQSLADMRKLLEAAKKQ
jgi:hypothetical protein